MITLEKVIRFKNKYNGGVFMQGDEINIIYKDKLGFIDEYEGIIWHYTDDRIMLEIKDDAVDGVFDFYYEGILAMTKVGE